MKKELQEFRDWLSPQYANGSGAPSSYERAVGMVLEHLGISSIDDISIGMLRKFYNSISDKNSQSYKDFLNSFDSRSYLEKNFVTASLAKFFEYAELIGREKSMVKAAVNPVDGMRVVKQVGESKITIHPRAIEAMGADLVTDDNIAMLEIVKNSYDAFAYNVKVEFGDSNNFIKISDDGLGMSLDTLRTSWGQISTTYKKDNFTIERNGEKRVVSGNKGLGRLSTARLGRRLTIITKQLEMPAYRAEFLWEDFYKQENTDNCKYSIYEIENTFFSAKKGEDCGTIVLIEDLHSDWIQEAGSKKKVINPKLENLRAELSRVLDPFAINKFKIELVLPNNEITLFNYQQPSEEIITHPLISKPPYKIKGVIDKEQNLTYVATILKDFKDPAKRREIILQEKVISWKEIQERCVPNIPTHDDASCGEFSFEIRVWDLDSDSLGAIFEEYKDQKNIALKSSRDARAIIATHKGVSVYRDGVLVLPKSEHRKDWLGLDKQRIGRVGSNLSTSQIIGKIEISLESNPGLEDTTSRESFNVTKEYDNFFAICFKGIMYEINSLRNIDRQEGKKQTVRDIFAEVSPVVLQEHVAKAVKEKKTPQEIQIIVDDHSKAQKQKLKELQERVEYYAQLASAGTFSKIIIHEIKNSINPIQRFNKNVVDKYSPLEGITKQYYEQAEAGWQRLNDLSDAFSPLSRVAFKKEKHTTPLFSGVNKAALIMEDY